MSSLFTTSMSSYMMTLRSFHLFVNDSTNESTAKRKPRLNNLFYLQIYDLNPFESFPSPVITHIHVKLDNCVDSRNLQFESNTKNQF